MATVSGKYQKHEVTGQTVPGEKVGLKVTAWTLPDGKAAPKSAGLVGKTFETVGKAGVEAIKTIRVFEKLAPLPTDMRLIFKEAGAAQPVNARSAGGPKPSRNGAKAEKVEAPAKVAKSTRGPKASSASSRSARGSSPKADGADSEQPTRSRRTRKAPAVITEYKNQAGLEKGQTRYWCHGCQKSFVVSTPKNGAIPDACPEGHSLESLDLVGATDEVETLTI